MEVTVEGMVIDGRDELTAALYPSTIRSMLPPITVRPLTKINSLSDEQARNALSPVK